MRRLEKMRVLVTRPRAQGSGLAERLEAEGATAIPIPLVEIRPPEAWDGLDAALGSLAEFDWVVFTSASGVEKFVERADVLGSNATAKRIAVIGPATGKAVEELLGRSADLMPSRFVAEGLVEALAPRATGARVLLVRAAVAREVLPEALTAAGATVTVAEAYRNVVPVGVVAELKELLRKNPPDAITFTSGSMALRLAVLLAEAELALPAGMTLASIGPVTSRAMREVGLEPTVEAAEATMDGLVQALVKVRADAS